MLYLGFAETDLASGTKCDWGDQPKASLVVFGLFKL